MREESSNMKINEYLPLRDIVFQTLRKAILNGELEPGERLMETQLGEKLGVSRTRTAAASLLPPAKPAATGIRLKISI